MASEWREISVEAACSLVMDCPHSTPKWTDSGVVVIRNTYLKAGRMELSNLSFTDEETYLERVRRAVPQPGDLVISREAPIGEIAMIPEGLRACLGQRVVLLRANPNVCDARFLLYSFIGGELRDEILSHDGTGSTVSNLRIPSLKAAKVKLPPLSTQRQIAAILSAFDDKIELNRQMNRTLEQMARALFKSWFVDFDPVRAKMRGELPEGMDAETAALFPDELVEVEGREVPRGWRVVTVSDVSAAIFSGGTPDTRKPEYWNGNLPWFSSGETRNDFLIETEKSITHMGVENSSTRLSKPADILIAGAGQGFTRGQTSFNTIETYINQSVVAVRADTSKVDPEWLYLNLSDRYEEMRGISDGHSSRGSLTTKLLAQMPIVQPPLTLSNAFKMSAKSMIEMQIHDARESIHLAQIRDALLHRLVSGKMEIREIGDIQ